VLRVCAEDVPMTCAYSLLEVIVITLCLGFVLSFVPM